MDEKSKVIQFYNMYLIDTSADALWWCAVYVEVTCGHTIITVN